MSNSQSTDNLMNEILSFRDDAFYNLVEQQCGTVVLEIIKVQDISSVECLLGVNNIFTFLELDSDELLPLKKKAGIILNDGRLVIKNGIKHKVEAFLHTLHHLNRQHSSSSQHNSEISPDLIISEQLLQKFPFFRTLIIYSNFIEKSKIDFTFFNIMLNNMIKNFVIEEKGYRYDIIVRQFAASLYILGGRTAYEFIRLNIPAFLPRLFNYDGVRDYFNANQSTIGFCAEDCTAIIPKITYDTKSNTFVGFSLPLDNNGIPITNSYSTDSFTDLEQWCSDLPQAKSINACLIQPLSLSINHISPYLLAAFGTDNKFKSSNIILRWHHIYEECKLKGTRIIGYATNCDSRYLRCMRISLGFFGHFAYVDHPDNLKIDHPKTWSCVTDTQLTGTGAYLLLGDQLINMEPLFIIIDQISKLEHTLVPSDINPKDRQNYKSCTKISSDEVLNILEQVPIPNSIDNTHENKLHFPQHHKVSSTLRNASNSSNITIISKTDIENTVLNAYKYVSNLFKPLKIKHLLRNGQTIPIKELSVAISRQLEEFWTIENYDTSNKNVDLDTDSDDETENSIDEDVANDYESDEEVDVFDYHYNISNVNVSENRGIRLIDNVKEELAHTYFK
ncbi:unnamed protein product, partial [Rotaria sordida]